MSIGWVRRIRDKVNQGDAYFCIPTLESGEFAFLTSMDSAERSADMMATMRQKEWPIFEIRPASEGKPQDAFLVPVMFTSDETDVDSPSPPSGLKWAIQSGFVRALKPIEHIIHDIPDFVLRPISQVAPTGRGLSASLKESVPAKFIRPLSFDSQAKSPPEPTPKASTVKPQNSGSTKTVLELYEMASNDGPAVLPAGPGILGILEWDQYKHYEEVDTRLNYAWKVSVALLSHDESATQIKQTINLTGHGLHRKHEVAFAFQSDVLGDCKLVRFRGQHPGPGRIPIPGMYSGQEPATISTKGPPVGVELTFVKPVQVRRFSCLPISNTVIELTISVFQISIWFATEATAMAAVATFKSLIGKPSSPQKTGGEAGPPGLPRFEDFPAMPPGGISRL